MKVVHTHRKELADDADDEMVLLVCQLGSTTAHDLPALLTWTSVQRLILHDLHQIIKTHHIKLPIVSTY